MGWQWSGGPSWLLAVAHHDVLWLQVEVDHLNINKVACEFLSRWHRSDYPRFWGFGVCNCLHCHLHTQAPLSSIISYLLCVIAIQSVIWLDFYLLKKMQHHHVFTNTESIPSVSVSDTNVQITSPTPWQRTLPCLSTKSRPLYWNRSSPTWFSWM